MKHAHTRRRTLTAALAAVIALPLLAACSGEDDNPDPDRTGEIQTVRYLTGFGNTMREAYALVANTTGIAAEHGVEFDIEIGKGGAYNHSQLVAGSVDMMAADSSGAFTRHVNGEDTSFQVLAAVHNKWAMSLLGYRDTGLETVRDLNGRTIGLAEGTIAQRMWPTYAELTPGIDADSIEVIPTDPSTQVGQMIGGQLDAIALFSVSAPGLENSAGGREVTALPWADAFPDMHGNAIIAGKELIAEDPDLVVRSLAALMQALEWMLDNPLEAAQMWAETVPEADPEVAAEEAEQMREFCYGQLTDDQPLGTLDETRVVQHLSLLSSLGEIDGDFNDAMPDADNTAAVVNFELLAEASSR